MEDVVGELLVVVRVLGVPPVLDGHRVDHLVDQRVAQSGDLREVAEVAVDAVVLVEDPGAGPAGRGPYADHRAGRHDAVRAPAVHGQVADRHLQREGVHVEVAQAVDAGHVGQDRRDAVVVGALEWTQVAEVEDAAQVDVESVGALPGEHAPSAGEAVIGLCGQRRVVRGAPHADVHRWAGQVAAQDVFRAPAAVAVIAGPAGQGERLRPVPGEVAGRGDRAGVVQERVRVTDRGVEGEAVDDVGAGVASVRNLDLVADVVGEFVEVRATVGQLERIEVGDQRDGVGPIRTDEGVNIGVVGRRIFRDLRRFTVRRHGKPFAGPYGWRT